MNDLTAGRSHDRRLYLGIGLLVAGSILAVLGGGSAAASVAASVGVPADSALPIGFALAGALAPASFLALVVVLPTDRSFDRAAAAGAGVAVLGLLVVGVGWPGAAALAGAAAYGLGAVVAFAALLAAVTLRTGRRGRPTGAIHSGRRSDDRTTVADGGEDDDLTFPLDEE